MVHLTTRFAVLAVAIAALNSVDVVAMPAGHSKSGIASKAASQHDAPVLPLPLRMQHGSKASRKGDTQEKTKVGKDEETHKGGKKHKERQQDVNNARSLNQAFFHRFSRPHPRHDYDDKVVMNGDHEHLRISDHDRHGHHGHHWDDEKVVMNGDHEHVRIKDRRSSSSVLVHSNHGQSFLVSRTHRAISRRNPANLGKRVDENAPSGTIDLILGNDAGQPKKLGSLYMNMDKNPVELDASDSNSTTSYMVEDMNTPVSEDPNVKYVLLHFLVTDSRKLAVVPWCATYNSSPDHPAPMTVVPCRNSTEPSNPQESQSFMYTVDSGAISPMGASSTASTQDITSASASVAAAEDMLERGTSFQARDTAQTQNVTLIFTPNGPQEDSERAQAAEDAVYTTVTETVTATVTASSNSPSATAQDMDSSSFLFTTASASSTLTVSSSSSTPSINALKVEVFSASSSDVASSSTMTGLSSAISPTSPTPMSSSVNAEAVASGIANPSSSATDPLPLSSASSSTTTSSTISVAARAEMTAVATAPYQWQFRREA